MKQNVKRFCMCFLIVLVLSIGYQVFADNASDFAALVRYNDKSATFDSLEEAVIFINESKDIKKAEIELYENCYISKTITIESGKDIQIFAAGHVEIKRKFSSDKKDDYLKACMFETKKDSILSFGKADGMKKGCSLTINGGAEWKNSIISKNIALSSDEAMIIMKNGTVNVFDSVSFISNDCSSEYGSAFYVERGCLNIYNGEIIDNRSKCGAAIYSEYGNIAIYGGRITGNYSENYGNVYIQFGSSISVKGNAYVLENYDNKNLYLENTYIDIVGKLTGKLGVTTYKTTLSTLVAYANNASYLDTEAIVYDKSLDIYDLYIFNDKTIRIGAETKIFTEMPELGIYEYDGKQKPANYYVKQYTEANGKIIGLAKCTVEYYERNKDKMGKQLVDAPVSIGEYYAVIAYEGNSILGYAPCTKTEKFSIQTISEVKDNFYYNLYLDNKDDDNKPLVTCIDIMPVNADILSREIMISDTVIEKALENAYDFLGRNSRDIALKISISQSYADSDLKLCLSHKSLNLLLNYSIDSLNIDNCCTELSASNNALYYLYNTTANDLYFKIESVNKSEYSSEIKRLVNNRPLYDYSIYYKVSNRFSKEEIVEVDDYDLNSIQIAIKFDTSKSADGLLDLINGRFNKDNHRYNDMYFIIIDNTGNYKLIKYDSFNEKSNEFILKTDKTGIIGIVRNHNGQSYKDILNHWAFMDIELMIELKLFTGFSEIEFGPDEEMTRGMFVTVLGRVANNYLGASINTSGKVECRFKDVEKDKYYTPYIEWAVNAKIVNGTGNNCFQPDMPVSREEMCVMLKNFMKTYNFKLNKSGSIEKFEDEGLISSWALESIYEMQMTDIIRGSNNLFNPKQKATRAEISVIINRLLNNMCK